MKKFIFHLLFLATFQILFFGITFAQSNYSKITIDELKTLRGNVLKAVSDNDSLSMARAYYKLALKYDYLDQNDSCDLYYKRAIAIAKELKNVRAEAIITNALATTLSDRGLHEEAIKLYKEVIELFFSANDIFGASGVMLNSAAEYLEMGKYKKGLEISLDALKLRLETTDSTNIVAFYHQIGSIFRLVDNNEKWKEYILLANSIAKKNEKYGDFYRRMDLLNELGEFYFSNGNLSVARKYYDTLYIQSKKKDYLVGITAATSNLVPLLKKEKKYNEALVLSKKALALAKRGGKIYSIIHNLVETAKIEIILSRNNLVKNRLDTAKELSIKYNYPDELISIYKLLSELNFEKGNYKLAFQNLSNFYTLKDSIEDGKTKGTIAELEKKYQTEKKDNQIKLLNKENLIKQKQIDFQNKTFFVVIIFSILLLSLILLFYYQYKLKSENRILNIQQKLLRSQMNPHFIFNSLIAIQNYILKNRKFEASDYLAQFATLMRAILEGSRDDFILLSRDIELLKYYVSLQQLRFENSFEFNLELDENINTDELKIPPMILQPFVENAIEHGLRNQSNMERVLLVKYALDKGNLCLKIVDNGPGIKNTKSESAKNHQSYAIKITNERLINITKIYKVNINISICDLSEYGNEHGTEIKFLIPIKLLKENNDSSHNS